MYVEIKNHEWELNGDLETVVFLNLAFNVSMSRHEPGDVELIADDTEIVGVTFARGKSDCVCDNADLPEGLFLSFVKWFHEAYSKSSAIRDDLEKQAREKAVEQSWELAAA